MTPLYTVTRGRGPDLLLVHGSATDADGWLGQFAALAGALRLTAYDRRGTHRSPSAGAQTVEAHAEDLLELAMAENRDGPWVCGFSFGAVVALHAAVEEPTAFAGLIVIEPPLPAEDDGAPIPDDFMDELLAIHRQQSPEASARFFLSKVLGPTAAARLPEALVQRSESLHGAVLDDCRALQSYRLRYAAFGGIEAPVLLVGGRHTPAYFPPALDRLQTVLPRGERLALDGGHQVHVDAAGAFHQALLRFVGGTGA